MKRVIRALVTATLAATFGALAACSSAPDDAPTMAEQESMVASPEPSPEHVINTACYTLNPYHCFRVTPKGDANMPRPLLQLGCKSYSEYWWSSDPLISFFVVCPNTPALRGYVEEWAASWKEMWGRPHLSPNACDVCIPHAPAGMTYVFWERRMVGPTCPGGCPDPGTGW